MASTVSSATLKVTIREEIELNGHQQGGTTTKSINVGVTANKVGYMAGLLDDGDVRYIRITNLDDTNFISLTFRDEDNTEFRVKVDAGHSFIYSADNADGLVDTMKASGSALASGLADLVDITVDADTASCDVEVFVASV